MRRKVTIEDIARDAGASVTTVSMVLRDKPGIGEETRQRVLAVARELGYRRRPPAVDARSVRTVAMILRARTSGPHEQAPGVNPFYSDVISGIERAARQARINLLYGTLPVDRANHPYELPDHLLQQGLDGILLIGAFSADTVAAIADDRSAPTVLVDAPALPSGHDAVVSDNHGGAYRAVRHLVSQGHRHIALAGHDLDADPNFRQRREGYLVAVEEASLDPYVITTGRTTTSALRDALAAALAVHTGITAVFGANDSSAIEAMRAVQGAGRRVPEDVSIVGFDDIALASEVRPALTTMAVDRFTMGRQAVHLLQHRLAWPGSCRLMTILQPELRSRDSVAPWQATPLEPVAPSAAGTG